MSAINIALFRQLGGAGGTLGGFKLGVVIKSDEINVFALITSPTNSYVYMLDKTYACIACCHVYIHGFDKAMIFHEFE